MTTDIVSKFGDTTLDFLKIKGKPTTLGGQGSGNFGHAGRPGEVGGSGKGLSTIEERASRLRKENEKRLQALSPTQAAAQLRDHIAHMRVKHFTDAEIADDWAVKILTERAHPLPNKQEEGAAAYDFVTPEGNAETAKVHRNEDGTYTGETSHYDFTRPDAGAMRDQLRKYKAHHVGWER